MKESEVQRLAEQGNVRAIAKLLAKQFRSDGIRVIAKEIDEKHLKIQFESSPAPAEKFIREALKDWQKTWQENTAHTITAEGLAFGEIEPEWSWRICSGVLSPEERQQSPEAFAAITSPQKAEFEEQNITLPLKKELASYLWQVQITPLKNTLVVKLTVLDQRDRLEYCEIVQNALLKLDPKNIERIHLHVFHREQQKYLFKTNFALHGSVSLTAQTSARTKSTGIRTLEKEGRSALITGGIIGLVLFLLPPSRFILDTFLTLFHELGHAIAYWIFGYPAIPSFDFMFGGGITLALNRFEIIVFLVYGALAYAAFQYRQNPKTLGVLGGFTLCHCLCLITGWDQMFIIVMGHIAEILVVFFCLYCALGKYFCYVGGERTLYGMLASFCFLENWSFFWKLMFDSQFRIVYRVGKGGMLDHDLVRLTQNFFPISLEGLAGFLFVLTLVMPPLAILLFRYEPRWAGNLYSLLQRSPDHQI